MDKKEEQQKPVVKQFVANWYEKNKNHLEFNMWDYVYRFEDQENTSFKEWFNDPKTEPFKTLVNMHQFGYKVEKEKRYFVKMKNIDTNFNFLNRHRNENYWIFSSKDKNTLYQTQHTRKELEEAGFGWVFFCEGMEVTEVEEG